MAFNESLIIYLSLGAPVAVYYFQRQAHSPDANNVAKILLAFLLWPATFVGMIVQDSARARTHSDADPTDHIAIDRHLQTIFDIGKRDLNQIGRGQETAQFREMLERYTGLLSAVGSENTKEETVSEFYVAAGHPKAKLATACYVRRATEKLNLHSRAASCEVRKFFAQVPVSLELRSTVVSLAETLGDSDTVESLGGSTYHDLRTEPPVAALTLTREHTEPARAA